MYGGNLLELHIVCDLVCLIILLLKVHIICYPPLFFLTWVISDMVFGVCKDTNNQSYCNIPNIGLFKNGIVWVTVKSSKAADFFARMYCIFIVVTISFLEKNLCYRERKNNIDSNNKLLIAIKLLVLFFLWYLWLTKDNYFKSDFEVSNNEVDLKAMNQLTYYLQ